MKVNSNRRSFLLKLLVLRRLRQRFKRSPRQMSTRPLFMNRVISGEHVLVQELREDPHYHYRYFRMNSETFNSLLMRIKSKIQGGLQHTRPISPLEKLAITLRFLASGNSQVSLAFGFRISPSAVSNLLRETMNALCDALQPEYLPVPSINTWIKSERGFQSKWNFPNCCGAIDGKHIRIRAPPLSGSLNFNYKGYYSMVLLAIVGPNYEFLAVDIGACGSLSDGGVFSKSTIGKSLQNKSFGLPGPKPIGMENESLPHVIVGDDAFPLREYLMKPFPGKELSTPKSVFNYRLSRARMVSEDAFGILTARWRILHTCIIANPDFIKLIIKTCVVLHNFLLSKNDSNGLTPDSNCPNETVEGTWRNEVDLTQNTLAHQGSNHYSQSAAVIREKFMKLFNEDITVPWQMNMI